MPRETEPHPDDLMTTGEAARVLGLSTDMVRLLERDGRLPSRRTTNGLRLFRRGEVEKLAAERARAAASRGSAPSSPDRQASPSRWNRGGER